MIYLLKWQVTYQDMYCKGCIYYGIGNNGKLSLETEKYVTNRGAQSEPGGMYHVQCTIYSINIILICTAGAHLTHGQVHMWTEKFGKLQGCGACHYQYTVMFDIISNFTV